MKRQNEIVSWIVDALREYKELEEIAKQRVESKDIEYSYHNERPVAQFITNYIDNKLGGEAFAFHELPIKGLSDNEIKNIKSHFITKLKISDKDIKTKFKRYYIDGYVGFHESEETESNGFFIEYKVNNRFNHIDFAIDILKFLIYTSRTEQKDTLLYIELRKEDPSFGEISNLPYQSNISDINFDNLDQYNIFIINKDSMDIESEKMQKQLILFDKLKDFSDEISGGPTLTENEFAKYKGSSELNNIDIYGSNVFFSKKIIKNAEKIILLYEKIKVKNFITDSALSDDDYHVIKGAINALRNSDVATENESTISHYVNNKMSNWLLAFLKAIADKLEIDDPEFITDDVYHDGTVHEIQNNNFEDMVNVSSSVIADQSFGNERLFKVVKHLNNVIKMVFEKETISSEGELPKLNESYIKYKKISKSTDMLKDIKKELFNLKRDTYTPGYDIENDIEKWSEIIIKSLGNSESVD